MAAKRSRSPSQMTTSQSFCTTIVVPVEANLEAEENAMTRATVTVFQSGERVSLWLRNRLSTMAQVATLAFCITRHVLAAG